MHTPSQSKVGAQRVSVFKQTYCSPIRGLTPAMLIWNLEAYNRGEIKQAVLLWQQMIERDDMISACAAKRARAVSALQWEILPIDDSAEAAKHTQALKYFYNNLTAYDGVNEMERGGVRQLINQMMTAVGLKYAMHEIIWRPNFPAGLTADFKFLPLHFFENTTGRLRYLRSDNDLKGADLDEYFGPGSWMCNASDGLMVASSIAYLFKVPAGLKAWVSCMEKFGMPPLHAKTGAVKGSEEWDEIKNALEGYGEDLAIVTDESTSINALELNHTGMPPHQALVDRMDRAISRIWMGGDLATMSSIGASGTGSNPQSDDLAKLQSSDAEMITDALQHYVDSQVIRMSFGDVTPRAYFKLKPPTCGNVDRELRIDEFLISVGVPIGKKQLMERYGLTQPNVGEELATAPAPAPIFTHRATNEVLSRIAKLFAR